MQRLRDAYAIEGVTCHVSAMPSEPWNRVVTIDKGSDDGVAPGQPVMGSTGLVGQVKSSSPHSAEVRLLQDPNSGVAVLLQSNRAEGLLKGSIDGLLYLEDIDNDVEVKVGDNVITSGVGGGYLRGLMVGTVVRVEETNGQSIRRIVVAPNDTVAALEEVMVVTGMGSEGALSASADAAKANGSSGEAQGGAGVYVGNRDIHGAKRSQPNLHEAGAELARNLHVRKFCVVDAPELKYGSKIGDVVLHNSYIF
jgi:rod shape-determining protein MreC